MPAGIIQGYRDVMHTVHGIFVGINQYEATRDPKKFNSGSGISHTITNLNGCVNDAKDIMTSIGADRSELLLDEQASRAAIFGKINDFMLKQNSSGSDQSSSLQGYLLIISISAHGVILSETEEFCVAPFDYSPANPLGTAFSTLTLISAMSVIARRGGKVLLILDACHAGGINFDISKYGGLMAQGGVSCLSSCSSGEKSFEVKGRDNKPGGIFTHKLVEGLSGLADTQKTGVVTLRDLYDYVYSELGKEPQGRDQHPLLIGTLSGNTVLKKL